MEKEIEKANKIFTEISQKLSSKDKGKIVAIDPESGDYAVGLTELEAYKKLAKEHAKKQFVFKRVGFTSAYFVGAF